MKSATVKIVWDTKSKNGWFVSVNKSNKKVFVAVEESSVIEESGNKETQIIQSEFNPATHKGGFNSLAGGPRLKGEGYNLDTISCADGIGVRCAKWLFENAKLEKGNEEGMMCVNEQMLMVLYQSDLPGLYVAGMVMTGCSATFKV
jgi:hypothetical protein